MPTMTYTTTAVETVTIPKRATGRPARVNPLAPLFSHDVLTDRESARRFTIAIAKEQDETDVNKVINAVKRDLSAIARDNNVAIPRTVIAEADRIVVTFWVKDRPAKDSK